MTIIRNLNALWISLIAYANIQSTISELENYTSILSAEQYARKDTIVCVLNPRSPWSSQPRSTAKFHKLTLTISGESIQVASCWQNNTIMYWTALDGTNSNKEANCVEVYGELDYSRLEKQVLDYTSEVKMPQTLSLSPASIYNTCLLYTSPSPRDRTRSRMPSSA